MAMTKEQKQFVEMMKNPEVRSALGGSDDADLEALLEDLEVTDDDTLESVTKKSNAKIKKLIKYFTEKVDKAESSAVEKATKDTREKEDAKIAKFAADNPGMKNQDVIDLMQPLYDKGKPLDECYAAACKALDLDLATGEAPSEGEEEAKKEDVPKGAKQSAKSGIGEETEAEEEAADEPDPGPKSLDEALAAADAAYVAKHGDPFETKED